MSNHQNWSTEYIAGNIYFVLEILFDHFSLLVTLFPVEFHSYHDLYNVKPHISEFRILSSRIGKLYVLANNLIIGIGRKFHEIIAKKICFVFLFNFSNPVEFRVSSRGKTFSKEKAILNGMWSSFIKGSNVISVWTLKPFFWKHTLKKI